MLKKKIKILSFDPGLTCTGWALTEYDATTGESYISKRGKIEGKKAFTKYKEKLVLFGKQMIQLTHLEDEVTSIMRFKPDYVVSEDAFHQPGRTAAYAALVKCIYTIEQVVKRELGLPLFKIAPTSVKQMATTYGQADKLTVQESLLANPSLSMKETKQNPTDRMTEHEADAIAVGIAFVQDNLPSILLSC